MSCFNFFICGPARWKTPPTRISEGDVFRYKILSPHSQGHSILKYLGRSQNQVIFVLMSLRSPRAATKYQRDRLYAIFYLAFEDQLFLIRTKIFNLETVQLNKYHKNYLKVQGKIDKQIDFLKKLKDNALLMLYLLRDFYLAIDLEFDFLYKAHSKALALAAQSNKLVKLHSNRYYAQYGNVKPCHSKWKKASLPNSFKK